MGGELTEKLPIVLQLYAQVEKNLKCEFRITSAFVSYCINILGICLIKYKVFATHNPTKSVSQILLGLLSMHHALVASKRAIAESFN